jgi:hypothetical protein
MTPEEILEHLKTTRRQLDSAYYDEAIKLKVVGVLVTVESLLAAVEALAAHVASQATDGK